MIKTKTVEELVQTFIFYTTQSIEQVNLKRWMANKLNICGCKESKFETRNFSQSSKKINSIIACEPIHIKTKIHP